MNADETMSRADVERAYRLMGESCFGLLNDEGVTPLMMGLFFGQGVRHAYVEYLKEVSDE